MTNVELLQDLINNIDSDLKNQETDFIAIRTAIVVLKKRRSYLVAKKKGFEEDAKKIVDPKPMSKKQKGRRGAQTPFK